MADDRGRDLDDEHNARAQDNSGLEGVQELADTANSYAGVSPGDARLGGRGNAPVRSAVLQRIQQTQGNRAVQRILQRSAATAEPAADEDIGASIQSRSGGGSAIDGGVRQQLEGGLGADLSGVRVHTDGEADRLSRSVDAVAFTTGPDIFFRQGAYNPGSTDGLHLLAHEAAHTVQQAEGPVSGTPTGGGVSVSDPSDSFEQAADNAASQVVARSAMPGAPPVAAAGTAPAVQREEAPKEDEEDELPPLQTMSTAHYGQVVQREATKPEEEEEEVPPVQTMRSGTAVQRHADEGEEVNA